MQQFLFRFFFFFGNDFMTQKIRDSILRLTLICPAGAFIPSAGKCLCTAKISALAQINRVRSEETMRMFSLFCPVYEFVNFSLIYGQTCVSSHFWQEPVKFQPLHKSFAINCVVSGDYS